MDARTSAEAAAGLRCMLVAAARLEAVTVILIVVVVVVVVIIIIIVIVVIKVIIIKAGGAKSKRQVSEHYATGGDEGDPGPSYEHARQPARCRSLREVLQGGSRRVEVRGRRGKKRKGVRGCQLGVEGTGRLAGSVGKKGNHARAAARARERG